MVILVLPRAQLAIELSRIAEAPAGTVVTQMGEPGDSFFIIIDGSVEVRTPKPLVGTPLGSAGSPRNPVRSSHSHVIPIIIPGEFSRTNPY